MTRRDNITVIVSMLGIFGTLVLVFTLCALLRSVTPPSPMCGAKQCPPKVVEYR